MSEQNREQIWQEEYKISSFLVNLRGRAGLYAVLNLLQDVGWMHAFATKISLGPDLGWVFTRQKLMMHEWPGWNETVKIRTWLRPPEKGFWFRDYEVYVGERKLGEATASFMVMDLKTRKSVRVDFSHTERYWNKGQLLSRSPEKIFFEGEGEEVARFRVRNSDLDMNNHVNNTRYAQWILDSLPVEVLRAGVNLHGYEVNFLAEAKLGDEILIRKSEAKAGADLDATVFQGVRSSDERAIFTARLLSRES